MLWLPTSASYLAAAQLPGPEILEFGLSEIFFFFFLVPLFPHTGKICFQLMGAKGRLIAWHF